MGKTKKDKTGDAGKPAVTFLGVDAADVPALSNDEVLALAPLTQGEVLAAFDLPYEQVTGRPADEVDATVVAYRRRIAQDAIDAGVSVELPVDGTGAGALSGEVRPDEPGQTEKPADAKPDDDPPPAVKPAADPTMAPARRGDYAKQDPPPPAREVPEKPNPGSGYSNSKR